MAKRNKVSCYTHTKQQLDDYANQNNPNNKAYKARTDNRANQLKRKKINLNAWCYQPDGGLGFLDD